MKIVVVDETKAALHRDHSNIAGHQKETIEQADLVIRMTPDGYLVSDTQDGGEEHQLELVRPLTEAQLSAETAKQHVANRLKRAQPRVIEEMSHKSYSIPQQEDKQRDFEF